jgi:hypothetical protein
MSGTEVLEWRILLTGTAEVPPGAGGDDGLNPDELDLALAKMFPGDA